MDSIPGSGSSPGGRNGNPLPYSCLDDPTDRTAWWVTVHGVTESDTSENTHTHVDGGGTSPRQPLMTPTPGLPVKTGILTDPESQFTGPQHQKAALSAARCRQRRWQVPSQLCFCMSALGGTACPSLLDVPLPWQACRAAGTETETSELETNGTWESVPSQAPHALPASSRPLQSLL